MVNPTRPLLSYGGQRGPLAPWMAILVPTIMVLVGCFLATASASLGQANVRGQAFAELRQMRSNDLKDLALVDEQLKQPHSVLETIILLTRQDRLARDAERPINETRIWSYRKTGRVFTQWDGYRYEEVIDEGYLYHLPSDTPEVKASFGIQREGWPEIRSKNVVWYPLYPILGYIVKSATGLPTHHALTVVAWSCLLAGSIVVFHIIRRLLHEVLPSSGRDFPLADAAATCALGLLLYGPASIFLYANYTESLFILLFGLFFMMIQDRRWLAAAIIAGIASACRSQGVLFGPMLGVIYLIREDRKPLTQRLAICAGLGLISEIGLACYVFYLASKFQAPFAFMEAQVHWKVGINSKTVGYALNPIHALDNLWEYAVRRPARGRDMDWAHLWEAMCVIAPPIILIFGRRILALEWLIAGWAFWLLPYVSQSLGASKEEDNCLHWMSLGRFTMVILPLHIVIGTLIARARWLTIIAFAASAVGFAILAYTFGMREWVG